MFNFVICEDIIEVEKCLVEDAQKAGQNYAYPAMLHSKEAVNNDFQRIIGWYPNAFKDKYSKQIIREIDHSRYVGKYEIKTPIGKTIVTSMCSGAKLALLLEYYRKKHIAVYTDWSRAGDNVWEFLGKSDKEYTIYLSKEDGLMHWYPFAKYIKGYSEDEWFDMAFDK